MIAKEAIRLDACPHTISSAVRAIRMGLPVILPLSGSEIADLFGATEMDAQKDARGLIRGLQQAVELVGIAHQEQLAHHLPITGNPQELRLI
jgi:hypothetical protein